MAAGVTGWDLKSLPTQAVWDPMILQLPAPHFQAVSHTDVTQLVMSRAKSKLPQCPVPGTQL